MMTGLQNADPEQPSGLKELKTIVTSFSARGFTVGSITDLPELCNLPPHRGMVADIRPSRDSSPALEQTTQAKLSSGRLLEQLKMMHMRL